jgi:hypothetical protein
MSCDELAMPPLAGKGSVEARELVGGCLVSNLPLLYCTWGCPLCVLPGSSAGPSLMLGMSDREEVAAGSSGLCRGMLRPSMSADVF